MLKTTIRPAAIISPRAAPPTSSTRIARPPSFKIFAPSPTLQPFTLNLLVTAAAASDTAPTRRPIGNPANLPTSTKDQVNQAVGSVKAAWQAGVKRQSVELSLPLIGATDLDDWPGGIRQQFKAAAPMVESLLRQLKGLPGLEGPLTATILDSADAVGAWTGDNLAAVLFPTAETLKQVRAISEKRPDALVLIVNPQWTSSGQVVSDFGIFPWQRKAAEEVVGLFQASYALQQLRINGDNVRWLLSYPNGWQINVVTGPDESTCILQSETRPTYQEVEAKLRSLSWTMSSKGLFERIAIEAEFNRRSIEKPPPPQ